jgi:hypothetical protein
MLQVVACASRREAPPTAATATARVVRRRFRGMKIPVGSREVQRRAEAPDVAEREGARRAGRRRAVVTAHKILTGRPARHRPASPGLEE